MSTASSSNSGRIGRRFAVAAAAVAVLAVATPGAADDRVGEPKDAATPLSAGQVVEDLASGVTADDLAAQLVGAGVQVTSATYTGDDAGGGRFSGIGVVGFDAGVVLGSGQVADVVGPNTSDAITTDFTTPGDPDLDALVAPFSTQDAAVLTIEFVPQTTQVAFSYVFTSDEYNEFVNSSFDDVFAFFVNGVNCATVNGDRVSVNSINNGNPFGTPPISNSELYRNNDPNDPASTLDTEMDGLTTVLTCSGTVNAGVPNTLKMAIADTSDGRLDSSVFIQAGSLVAVGPPAPVETQPTFTG